MERSRRHFVDQSQIDTAEGLRANQIRLGKFLGGLLRSEEFSPQTNLWVLNSPDELFNCVYDNKHHSTAQLKLNYKIDGARRDKKNVVHQWLSEKGFIEDLRVSIQSTWGVVQQAHPHGYG